jgi:hypothetical protein
MLGSLERGLAHYFQGYVATTDLLERRHYVTEGTQWWKVWLRHFRR